MIQNNIKQVFKTLALGMDDPEKTLNIVETYNEGSWATIYICASRFPQEEEEYPPELVPQ